MNGWQRVWDVGTVLGILLPVYVVSQIGWSVGAWLGVTFCIAAAATAWGRVLASRWAERTFRPTRLAQTRSEVDRLTIVVLWVAWLPFLAVLAVGLLTGFVPWSWLR